MTGQQFWDGHYSSAVFSSGKAPLPFLVQMLPRLQKGKVLDIGMGEGANAVYLARQGMTVKGFDISPIAIERADTLAKEMGVSIDVKAADMDLFLMGLMEYDTIIMTYFKPSVPRYYSEIIRALKQGGTLLVHSYLDAEMKEAIGQDEAYKNYYFRTNELLRQITKDLHVLYYSESDVEGRSVVQCLARKPLDKDVAKYKLFDMHTPQEGPQKSTQKDLAEALFKKKP